MGIKLLNDIQIEVDGYSDWKQDIQDFSCDETISFSDSKLHDKILIMIKHGKNCAITLTELKAVVAKFEDKIR